MATLESRDQGQRREAVEVAAPPAKKPRRTITKAHPASGAAAEMLSSGIDAPPPSLCNEGDDESPPQELTRERLAQMIRAGHHRAGSHVSLASQQQELLRWAEERVASGEPYSVTMAGKSPQKLHRLKLMYGVADEKGLLPNYNFGLTKAGWKRAQLMPELLRRRAEQIGRETGTTPNNCVVNIYLAGADYIAPQQDQAFADCSGKFESKLPLHIDRVGAARDLVFHSLDGDEIERVHMHSGDSYVLSGKLNMLVKHSVPACDGRGLCVTFSWRCVRNRVSPDGTFAMVNEKRVPLD